MHLEVVSDAMKVAPSIFSQPLHSIHLVWWWSHTQEHLVDVSGMQPYLVCNLVKTYLVSSLISGPMHHFLHWRRREGILLSGESDQNLSSGISNLKYSCHRQLWSDTIVCKLRTPFHHFPVTQSILSGVSNHDFSKVYLVDYVHRIFGKCKWCNHRPSILASHPIHLVW